MSLADLRPTKTLGERLREASTSPELTLRILDQALCEQASARERRIHVRGALSLLGSLSVRETAHELGISERRLHLVFSEDVGLSPKQWSRVHRFQRALCALYKGVDMRWAELATTCGYADQAHFSRDFRRFSGVDPTTYSLSRGRWKNHSRSGRGFRFVQDAQSPVWQHGGMKNYAQDCKSAVIPGMRYRDCLAAIEWLCIALGFEKHAVYMGQGNSVMHAELTFGNGMIMLGSASNQSEYTKFAAMPDDLGGREMRSVSLIVSDADAVYAQAKAAGAEMVFELREMNYGGKAFTCRDPEGYLWHVGTYNPWSAAGKS